MPERARLVTPHETAARGSHRARTCVNQTAHARWRRQLQSRHVLFEKGVKEMSATFLMNSPRVCVRLTTAAAVNPVVAAVHRNLFCNHAVETSAAAAVKPSTRPLPHDLIRLRSTHQRGLICGRRCCRCYNAVI